MKNTVTAMLLDVKEAISETHFVRYITATATLKGKDISYSLTTGSLIFRFAPGAI